MNQAEKKQIVGNYIKNNTNNQIIIDALSVAMGLELPSKRKFTAMVLDAMPEPPADSDFDLFLAECPETDARREMLDLEAKIDRLTACQLQLEVLV